MDLIYPEKDDPNFSEKLNSLKEYQIFKVPKIDKISSKEEFNEKSNDYCNSFEKAQYQHLMQHYLSTRSPYRSLLLYHGLGVGKTCSSITIAESLLLDHSLSEPPKIIVVSSEALKKSYIEQIFSISKLINKENLQNQCTGDIYRKLVHGNVDNDTLVRRILQLIRNRYKFITYDGLKNLSKQGIIEDKVIIIDEVHNLRQNEKETKEALDALENIIKTGNRNRLVLLSATPMYNETDEIMLLLNLLVMNEEHRAIPSQKLFNKTGEVNQSSLKVLKDLSSKYISYIRGSNPFTLASRLTPEFSDIPILKDGWSENITDGIVATNSGNKQVVKKFNKMGTELKENDKNISVAIQLLNTTFPNGRHGEDGFFEMFSKIDDNEPIQVKYRNNVDVLYGDNLKSIASKYSKILDIIKNSEGIVIIYSGYVWGGIVPFAAALEHTGFTRFGSRNLQQKAHIENNITYPNVPFPKYCFLTGDKSIMGNSKIDKMLETINSPDNIYGEKIKVVLMSPIAGEGLNFKNVREVHILDPWYHMNRIDQVIGRAIRTCSHNNLPIEERNVTVFLHASYLNKDQDTADIHAYKIANRKLIQSQFIENVIKNSAIDCNLLENVNYYPKSLFDFQISMRTSQKKVISYNFGDEEKYKPDCVNKIDKSRSKDFTMREEVILNLIPTLVERFKKYINKNLPKVYYSIDEISKGLKLNKEMTLYVLKNSIYPNTLIPEYRLIPHNDKIVLIKDKIELFPRRLKIESVEVSKQDKEESKKEESDECDIVAIMDNKGIKISNNENLATYLLYTSIDSNCWSSIAKQIIDKQQNSKIAEIGALLWKQGALVKTKDIKNSTDESYIGYIDIFNTASIDMYLKAPDGSYKEAKKELDNLMKNRVKWENTKDLYGIMSPQQFSKDKSSPFINKFKITTGVGKGAVCTTKKKPELLNVLLQVNPSINVSDTINKDQFCFTIALEMMKKNLVLFYPEWKPKL